MKEGGRLYPLHLADILLIEVSCTSTIRFLDLEAPDSQYLCLYIFARNLNIPRVNYLTS